MFSATTPARKYFAFHSTHKTLTPSSFCIQPPTPLLGDSRKKFPQSTDNNLHNPASVGCFTESHPSDCVKLISSTAETVIMSSSRNKGKRLATDLQQNQQHHPLCCLKPIIRPPSFKLALPIGPDKLPSEALYMTLMVPDGRFIGHRCLWEQQQNGSITLTRGWPEFCRTYQINLDSILLFKHKGNSEFQVRIFDFGGRKNTYRPQPSKEPPYEAKGTYRRARCINNPSLHKAKVIAQTHKTKWPFFVMDLTDRVLHSHLLLNVPHLSHFTGQRHTLFLSHGHIEVEATNTRFSGKRDDSFRVISGGWADFVRLCEFEPGGVGIFEVMSTEPVTVLQVRCRNDAASS
ncbi:hypothetical protein AHAS_Ahas11G0075500 [Arachis hypogaea]|uniref:TF-B3 domain-containing protein n=1 Tax=Arachis hypogaea TaxID=3818 RepID=A0A445APJ8_ARAHY|nr:hypothetical protein Ahy_B01g052424 [Arachis hypogaea]